MKVPTYLCGEDTIQPITDGETPVEQFGDGGQEPGVRRVWLGESITSLRGGEGRKEIQSCPSVIFKS